VDDHLSIRRHIWEADLMEEGHNGEVRHWSNCDEGGSEGPVPLLEPGSKFDVILASDVAYFRYKDILHSPKYFSAVLGNRRCS
jgi:hypothetical protein